MGLFLPFFLLFSFFLSFFLLFSFFLSLLAWFSFFLSFFLCLVFFFLFLFPCLPFPFLSFFLSCLTFLTLPILKLPRCIGAPIFVLVPPRLFPNFSPTTPSFSSSFESHSQTEGDYSWSTSLQRRWLWWTGMTKQILNSYYVCLESYETDF